MVLYMYRGIIRGTKMTGCKFNRGHSLIKGSYIEPEPAYKEVKKELYYYGVVDKIESDKNLERSRDLIALIPFLIFLILIA